MANTKRVDKELFRDEHYLGKPADDSDRIITRRIEILEYFEGFFDKSLSLVEAGCGNGATINRIAGRFSEALGIDLFDYSEPFAQSKASLKAENSRFLQMDLEQKLPDKKFDRLISFEVIEHLKNEDSVKQYAELLNAGGLAAVSVPNKWWIFETHGAKLPLLPWNRVPFFSWLPDFIHSRYANARIYTRKRIVRLLEESGFEVLDSFYITAPLDVLQPGKLKDFLVKNIFKDNTTTIPFLSTSIMVFARKK